MSKCLLILGASSDVGTGLIERIHSEYDVILAHYRSPSEKLEQLKNKMPDKIKLLQADFSSLEATDAFIKTVLEEYPPPTHIVHLSADRFKYGRFAKKEWQDIENDLNIQLRSAYKIISGCIGSMAKAKYGKIVFMLTTCTVNVPKYLVDYTTVKFALLGFMKALATDYADKKICVNAVSPSMIETKFLDGISHLTVEQTAAASPLKRNATVEDILPSIEFLLSDKSDYMTGQNIVVAGGSAI